MMEKVFNEEKLSENIFKRTFSEKVKQEKLVWHRDKEDRIISSPQTSDWMLQIDNQLPKKIKKEFIPKNVFHRLIKGSGDLELIIEKIQS